MLKVHSREILCTSSLEQVRLYFFPILSLKILKVVEHRLSMIVRVNVVLNRAVVNCD